MRTLARVITVSLLALGCDAGSPPAPAPNHNEVPLAVAVDGCTALFRPALCLRNPGGELTLWTDEPSLLGATWSLTWRIWHLELPIDPVDFMQDDRGTWWVVNAPFTAGHIELYRSDARGFTLELGTLSDAYIALGKAAVHQYKHKRPEDARATIRAWRAVLDFDPLEDYLLECLDAQFARTTDTNALGRLDSAADEIGDVSCRAQAHLNVAHRALEAEQYGVVDSSLEVLRAAGVLRLNSRVYADYFGGVLEQRRGRLDRSLISLEHARDVAVRTQSPQLQASIHDKLALAYFRLGYDERSRELEEQLRTSTWTPLRSNLLWLAVLRREADPSEPDPVPGLRTLLGEPKLEPNTARNVRLNLALALTLNKQFDAAALLLDEVKNNLEDIRSRVFANIALARIAAGQGRLKDARQILAATLERAREVLDAEFELQLQHELAQLEHDAGDRERARTHYAAAEDTIHQRLATFGPSADLSALSGVHVRHRAKYVQLLLELDDRSELRCVMLGARARHYQQLAIALDGANDPERSKRLLDIAELRTELEQDIVENWDATGAEQARLQNQWEKQRDTIRSLYAELDRNLEPGDLAQICAPWTATEHGRLLMHPGVDPGQWIFAFERADHIDAFTLVRGERELPEFVAEIHAQLDARGHLEQLTQLTVVSFDDLVAADFHTRLHARARPIQVRYSLGLGARPSTPHTTDALVYASTQGELPHAERATSHIAPSLEHAWSVSREWPTTLGPSERPELLLYTGHGASVGTFGFGSYLMLGDERRLTSAEIIAKRWGPRVVVLGTCEGGTPSEEVVDGGMSMATAFLLAGSELVIASDERVPDNKQNAELLEHLFAQPLTPDNAGAQLQEALTRAQQPVQGNPSHASWRVWVR